HRHEKMMRRGGTRGGVAQLAILAPDEGDQLWKCSGGGLGGGGERGIGRAEEGGRGGVRPRGERQGGWEALGRVGGLGGRAGAGGRWRRHDRARAGTIVDNDCPRELFL